MEPFDDLQGHGTACASLVGGKRAGVAKNSILVNVKVFDRNGNGQKSTVIAAFDWVGKQNDEGIISGSFGFPKNTAIDVAVNKVYNLGHFIVVAAGNSRANAGSISPARAANAFCVAASNKDNQLASFSNYGSVVDIIAPGENCLVAGFKTSGYRTLSGTSMACPLTAGVAAELKSMNPETTQIQLTTMMEESSLSKVISNLKGCPDRFLHISCAV